MNDATIIHVSSNRENPEFEAAIRKTLRENCGDLPIAAITQKAIPMDLGPNAHYCVVGDVGASGFNFCRQVLMACKHATTRFVISAESDCIYPPDYFTWRPFEPARDNVPYRNTNIYVQKHRRPVVCKKESSTFAQLVNREFYIERLEMLLHGFPEWSMDYPNFPKETNRRLFDEFAYWHSENPCVSFKTGLGMRKHSKTDEKPVSALPFWGPVSDLIKTYHV